ncbi:MAG: hypothetical protein HY279_15485 [Nitrospinae bacterium]|nr:hypothetical protein [Nitrospinota bacterium]
MQSHPNLFSEIHKDLFGPLSSLHASLYWQVLYMLYHLDFEDEPFEITKEFALDHVAQFLEKKGWHNLQGIDEDLPSDNLYEEDRKTIESLIDKMLELNMTLEQEAIDIQNWIDAAF